VRYRLLTTPWRVAVFAGVVFALTGAVAVTLVGGPIVASIVVAVGAAAIFGAVCGMISRGALDALAGLSPADRATVARTVAKGFPTTDRRLAPAVVRYAGALRRQNSGWINAGRNSWVLFVLAGVQAVFAISQAVDRNWSGVALRSALTVLFALWPILLRRNNDRLDAAERSAQALLERP
jgi:hypothetical protein